MNLGVALFWALTLVCLYVGVRSAEVERRSQGDTLTIRYAPGLL